MELKVQRGHKLFIGLVLVVFIGLLVILHYNQDAERSTIITAFPTLTPATAITRLLDTNENPPNKKSVLDCLNSNTWIATQNTYSSVVRFNQICDISAIRDAVTKYMELFHTEKAASEAKISKVLKDRGNFTRIWYGKHHLVSPLKDKLWTYTNNLTIFTVQLPPITTLEQWQALGLDAQKMYASLSPPKNCSATNISHICHHHLDINTHLTPARLDIHVHDELFPFFVYKIYDAVVDSSGNVHAVDVDLIPWQCKQLSLGVMPKNEQNINRYHSSIFVISQTWGFAYFHRNIESAPRLAIFVDFLRRHPEIRIHVNHKSSQLLLDALGLSNGIVSGPIHAQVVYQPQGGGCGSAHPVAVPLLQQLYAQMPERITNKCNRQSIVLITRHEKRWLAQSEALLTLLHELVSEIGYEIQVFSDYPQTPTFSETVSMFSRAALVVGPHGAGMSNLIFAQPQTYISEIQCSCRTNQCFQTMARYLGHIYIGLIGHSTQDCVPNKKADCGPIEVDLPYIKL